MMRFTKIGGEISRQKRITRTGGYAINDRFGPHATCLMLSPLSTPSLHKDRPGRFA